MYLLALAADYDETIAHDGRVDPSTYGALKRLKETGRRLILVTGRELRHLEDANLDLFDRVVAENGAVVYDPGTKRHHLIAPGPPAALVSALKEKRIEPLSVGECIVATWSPHETEVLEVIRDLRLEYNIVFNKGQSWCSRRVSTRRLA